MAKIFHWLADRLHQRLERYLKKDESRSRPQIGSHRTEAYFRGPMPRAHQEEKESLVTILANLGHRNPMEPLFMLEAFLSTEEHLTPALYGEMLKRAGHPLPADKAYEALELFTALGFAEKRFGQTGEPTYEHHHPGVHHDHLVCDRCGQTLEFVERHLDHHLESLAQSKGYAHLSHRLVIHGLCPECRQERGQMIRLTEATIGETLKIVAMEGEEIETGRLRAMGLHKGAEITILGGDSGGSLILLLDGCRLALGPEITRKIKVSEAMPSRTAHRRRPSPPGDGRD